ncbi:MAG: extracellular solute-binding protein, partial [Lachnospiraceae bacterium]|nr:extracellular solute-binding protein [Lachnospiraceae bacterium]
MKKRIIALLMCVLMAASVFTACGKKETGDSSNSGSSNSSSSTSNSGSSNSSSSDKTAQNITLKWAIWDESTTQYWGDIKKAYEASHQGVTIEMVDLGSTDYMTVLATELSGSGSDFDVVTIKDVPGYATLVQKNAIIALDDYIAKDKVDLKKFSGATDQVLVDGKLYELPFRNDFWVIFYNKDIFDRAGVAYPTNDMTWEEYDALARKVTDTT